jgi:hydroxymethylpyrimidine pyrophosphatase-like HAD family hydrolase
MADWPAWCKEHRQGALLCTVEELIPDLLAEPSHDGAAFNAFLSAAAVTQVLDEHLQRDVSVVDRIARRSAAFGALGRAAARVAVPLGAAAFKLRASSPAHRRWTRARTACAGLAGALADRVVAEGEHGAAAGACIPRPSGAAVQALRRLARSPLSREMRRLPASFALFDQQPEDLRRLAERFAAQEPDRDRPLLVVGLRTSGSYLAPLCAAFLGALGYERATWITLRPGQRLTRRERRIIATLARSEGIAVIVDDPPRTGAQVLATAEQLHALGIPAERVVPLLALFPGNGLLEERLQPYPAVLLPWHEWRICERLEPAELQRTLQKVLEGSVAIEAVSVTAPARGHVSAMIDATLDRGNDRPLPLRIHAEGVGMGYFADHTLAVARRLRILVPTVYGTQGGLMFREWLAEDSRLTEQFARERGEEVVAAISGYLAARRRRLPLAEDLSLRLPGEAVWEELAVMLARTFGAPGAGYLAARPLARLTCRRLLGVRAPALIDGDMRIARWFIEGSRPAARLVKTAAWRGRYSERKLHSGDWAVDLAAAAAELEREGLSQLAERLREDVARETGSRVSEERWLLYRLLDHLIRYESCLRRAASESDGAGAFEQALELERLMARIYRQYAGECFFADLSPARDGPLCAIDIDGVLEQRWLAFPVIPPVGALAVRALNRHEMRAVLATGRSLQEVRERCAAYRLAGGVAEYGAAIYDHASGRERSLLTDSEGEQLAAIRPRLAAEPGVCLDPDHRYAVRAHAIDARGRRSGLSDDLIDAATASGAIRAVRGELQTDFVPARIDKGHGLRALAAELGAGHGGSFAVALAVGDSDADLPMFAVAEHAFAPANATAAAAAAARQVRQPNAQGLLAAVAETLGHAPQRCAWCRPARSRSPEAALLLDWLGALNGGRASKATALLRVSAALVRRAPSSLT